ncbi:MAG TPA: LytTR family DNA-binding domain-containing protein [Bacteroidales bacterium]|nr:LytTR family DNA-binding domain-containing protein [Bacteroidales bacterium]
MKVLIIEDEIHTAKGLAKMLSAIDTNISVQKIIGSVEETIEYLEEKPELDLIFMDIQLSDGISFEIFSETDIDYPVIFTTSYDEYAIKAFQVNSVDYLLKPIAQEALQNSLDKYRRIFSLNSQKLQIEQVLKQLNAHKEYKSRILVKTPKGLLTLQLTDIAYFYVEAQQVFAKLFDNTHYPVDKTLNELEESFDPKQFFRLNRQFIASIRSIHNIHNYFNNTLKIELKPASDKEVIVSRYSIKDFKEWLDV